MKNWKIKKKNIVKNKLKNQFILKLMEKQKLKIFKVQGKTIKKKKKKLTLTLILIHLII